MNTQSLFSEEDYIRAFKIFYALNEYFNKPAPQIAGVLNPIKEELINLCTFMAWYIGCEYYQKLGEESYKKNVPHSFLLNDLSNQSEEKLSEFKSALTTRYVDHWGYLVVFFNVISQIDTQITITQEDFDFISNMLSKHCGVNYREYDDFPTNEEINYFTEEEMDNFHFNIEFVKFNNGKALFKSDFTIARIFIEEDGHETPICIIQPENAFEGDHDEIFFLENYNEKNLYNRLVGTFLELSAKIHQAIHKMEMDYKETGNYTIPDRFKPTIKKDLMKNGHNEVKTPNQDEKNPKEFTPDEKQLEVINIKSGEHLVLAPPGCGKTEILAERIIRARQNDIPFSEMLCLTFTNRAARGMTDRIRKVVKEPTQGLFIGNIHRFCSEFLFDYNLIPSNTSIIDEVDVEEILDEIKQQAASDLENSNSVNASLLLPIINKINKWDVYKIQHYLYQLIFRHPQESIFIQEPVPKVITYFSKAATIFPGYSNIIDVFSSIENICDAETLSYGAREIAANLLLASAYIEYKENNLLLDFDDVLMFAYSRMLGVEKVGKLNYKHYSWIQIDEVQDLNPLQFAIVDLIASKNANILFLGDQQQAIFSFMGAKLSSIQTLRNRCKDNFHPLTFNYRSPQDLLDIFNKYATDILKLPADYLPTTSDKMSPKKSSKVILSTPSNQSTAHFVDLIDEFKEEYKEEINATDSAKKPSLAILVSTNKAADEISKALENKGISHFKISGKDLFSTPQLKFIKSHFRLMSFPESFMDWSTIYRTYKVLESVGKSRSFLRYLRDNAVSPCDLMRDDNSTYLLDFMSAYDNNTFVVFDTETTGLNVFEDDIIQIAARKVRNGKTIEKFNAFIKTNRQIPDFLGDRVNPLVSVYAEQLEKGTLLSHEVAFNQFMEFAKGCTLIGHNIEYDYHILYYNFNRYCDESMAKELKDNFKSYFDTLKLSRLLNPRLKVFKLEKLIESLGLTEILASYDQESRDSQTYHMADEDVLATVCLLNSCYEKGISYAKLHTDFVTSANYEKVKRELILYRPYFLHSRAMLYNEASSKVPALVSEMRFIYECLCKNNLLNPLEKIEYVFDFLTNEIIDPSVEPHLIQQLDNHMSQIISFKEADLCGSESIKERIFLCTIHKAKGLEFTHVILADASENDFPRYNSDTPEKRMEDARLLYVAISRAKEKLTLIHPSIHHVWSTKWGKYYTFNKKVSPFLLPVEHMFNKKVYKAISNK